MSIFNLSDFERQGKIENDVHFTSMHELKQLLYQISDNALRSLQIYTPDMEAEIYNDSVFIKNLLSFCRGNRHAQIQILAADTSSFAWLRKSLRVLKYASLQKNIDRISWDFYWLITKRLFTGRI